MNGIPYYKKELYLDSIKATVRSVIKGENLINKSVLVTGASGMVCSYMADVLKQLGCRVYVAGRNIQALAERFPEAVPVEYDLSKEIAFNEDFDYIIHGAGYGHPGAFAEDPKGVLMNSILGTERLLEYGRTHNVRRFLYISSGEVYGNVDSMSSRACYPLGKQAGENLCAIYWDKYHVDTIAVRLCHTFGPGISEKDNRATAQFLRAALNHEDIILKSKGEQLRSYMYVSDSVSAILSVLTSGESGRAYDIASDECIITIADLARTIAEAAGVKVRFEIPNEEEIKQQSPIRQQVLDGEPLKRMGWSASYSIDEGCVENVMLLNML